MAQRLLLGWVLLLMCAAAAAHYSPEGAGGLAVVGLADVTTDPELSDLDDLDDLDLGEALGESDDAGSDDFMTDPDVDALRVSASNTKERIGVKNAQAEAVRSSLEPLEATLQSRKDDLAIEPQTEEEARQQMQNIGHQTASRANGAFTATEPELSADETSEFQWGQDAAKQFEKESANPENKHKATSADEKDLEALEHEVADNEASEEADDRRKAGTLAAQMKAHQAELRLENQEEEQADDMKKQEAQIQMRNMKADADQQTEEVKLQEELEKMTSSQVMSDSQATIQQASEAQAVLHQAQQDAKLQAKAMVNEQQDTVSDELKKELQAQQDANEAQAHEIAMENSQTASAMNQMAEESEKRLTGMAEVAGLAQSAQDQLMQSVTQDVSGAPDTAAIEHEAAADATKQVKSTMDKEMAKMMAEMAQYKKNLDHEAGPLPPDAAQTKQLKQLESKFANMEGQVTVVREEEQANQGNAAETSKLLQKERQLVEQEGVAKDQMQAAQATAKVNAAPKQPPVQQSAASSEVQAALAQRVDAMEKALLAVKTLHEQSSSKEAAHARTKALEAKLELMQKEIEDVKAEKSAATASVAAASAGQSELEQMKKELQHDAKVEQSMVTSTADTAQLSVNQLVLAKQKALLIRTRATLEAKLERLTRGQQLEQSKEETKLQGERAKLKLNFEKKLAETSELHSEAEQAEQLSVERSEQQMERKEQMDSEQSSSKEEELRESESQQKAELAKAAMEIKAEKAMEGEQSELTNTAKSALAGKISKLKAQEAAIAATDAKMKDQIEELEKETAAAEQKEQVASASAAEEKQLADMEGDKQQDAASKLRAGLFKQQEEAAIVESEKTKAKELKAEISDEKKKLLLKDETERKLQEMNHRMLGAQQKERIDEVQQADIKARHDLQEKATADSTKDMKKMVEQLEGNKAGIEKQMDDDKKEARKEQDDETAKLKREMDEQTVRIKAELGDQRSSDQQQAKELQQQVRNAQQDEQRAQVSQSTALAQLAKADAREGDEELEAAQKAERAKAAAMRAKIDAERAKAKTVEGKAQNLLDAGKRSAKAAVNTARATAKKQLKAQKLILADEEHSAEKKWAAEVANTQAAQIRQKAAAEKAKADADEIAARAENTAEMDAQKAAEEIAARAADEEKNAFAAAHKDTHSELGAAVEKQENAEKKVRAARNSLAKAKTEADDARARAKKEKEQAELEQTRAAEIVAQNKRRKERLARKQHEVENEFDFEKTELNKETPKLVEGSALLLKLNDQESELSETNKDLHKQVFTSGEGHKEKNAEIEQMEAQIAKLKEQVAETKATLRAVERKKAEQVLAGAKADQSRTQTAVDNQVDTIKLVKAKRAVALEATKEKAAALQKESAEAAATEAQVAADVKRTKTK